MGDEHIALNSGLHNGPLSGLKRKQHREMWSQKCRTADLVIIIYSKKCERTGFSVQLIYFNLAGSKLLARK